MDQVLLVNEQIEGGRLLMEALKAVGFEVTIAFWGKETEAPEWTLYLASPFVDEKGRLAAYKLVRNVLENSPSIWIDSLELRVLGLDDSLTKAALKLRTARAFPNRSGNGPPRPFPGLTSYGGGALAGYQFDAALIYPPPTPSPAT